MIMWLLLRVIKNVYMNKLSWLLNKGYLLALISPQSAEVIALLLAPFRFLMTWVASVMIGKGKQRLVKVERFGTRAGKPYHQIVYYISSLTINAAQFAQGIRGHWGIENRLHWVKDVVLDEDNSRMRQGNAPANFSIIRSLVLTILRYNGYSSITTGIRLISPSLFAIALLSQTPEPLW